MKKAIAIFLALLVVGLTGWNLFYSKPDPFTVVGGIVVLALVLILWIAILLNSANQTFSIAISIAIIVGSGASAVEKIFSVATPLATVNIDNSTNLYPMPDNPNPTQRETLDWVEGKWVIQNGQGAQKVFLYSWASSAVAFFLFLFVAWLLAKEFVPAKIRGGSIPIQFIMAVVFLLVGMNMTASPMNVEGMSQKTIEYIDIQWFAGFLQNRWWPMLLTGVMSVMKWIKGQAGRWQISATIVSAVTWLLIPLFQSAFNPTMISWTACSQMVFDSELTNSLCQEAFASGTTAILVLSLAWGLVVSMIADLLGLSGGDD